MVRDDTSPPIRTVLRAVAEPTTPEVVAPATEPLRRVPAIRRRRSTDRQAIERPPFVVAHRGACGVLPEHTLPAFARAIALGADAIEVDVVSTADGRLVARHEAELSLTTNAADRADLVPVARALGAQVAGPADLCAHDLTLRDLTRLRARQRMPHRPHSHDDLFMVPSFAQVVGLVRRSRTRDGRIPALHVELKDAARHAELGVPLERELIRDLASHGWNRPDAPVLIQSFEADCLLLLAGRSSVPLLQLARLDDEGIMRCSDRGLEAVATYAVGIGVSRELVAEVGGDLFARAHARGLVVHVYTFADDAIDQIDPDDALDAALHLGADALITDSPDSAVRARDRWIQAQVG